MGNVTLAYAGDGADLAAIQQAHDQNVDQLTTLLNNGLQLSQNANAKFLKIQLTMPDSQWIGIAATLGYLNSWVDDTANAPFVGAFRMDREGRVYMRGRIKSGTVNAGSSGNICTMPTGYAPAAEQAFAVVSNGAFGACTVLSDGSVRAAVGNNTNFYLDAVSWVANQPAAAPRVFNPQGTQDTTGVVGWPVRVAHGLKQQCKALIPVACLLQPSAGETPGIEAGAAQPLPAFDWKDDGQGHVQVNAAYGLSPGKRYTVTCLALTG